MAALRFSYGTQGNMTCRTNTVYHYAKRTAQYFLQYAWLLTIVSFPNPDLRWEKKQDYNGNIEFSILKGRIRGSLGYFYSKTTNAF